MQSEKGYIFNIQKFCLHDGAGIRTDVFFCGCNLRCKWCANPESQFPFSDARSEACEYTAEEILAEVLKDKPFYDKSGGGVTLTGGDLFMQYAFALELISALKGAGIHVAIETAGSVSAEKFVALTEKVDFVFIDCKHYDEQKHREGTGVSNRLILQNIRSLAASGRDYCVRIPVIPGYNDSLEDARAFCHLFREMGITRVQLLPFHQFGEKKYEKLGLAYAYKGIPQMHKEELAAHRAIFAEEGFDVQIGG